MRGVYPGLNESKLHVVDLKNTSLFKVIKRCLTPLPSLNTTLY